MQIISHRGSFLPEKPLPEIKEFSIVENSVEAFTRAFDNNWGIETDVRKTKDNEFVLVHNEDTKLFSQDVRKISDLTLKEIQKFHVPSLDNLFALANNKKIESIQHPFIAFQIKPGNDLETAINVATAMETYHLMHCIIFDVTFSVAKKLREQFSWLNISVSVGEKNYSETIYTPKEVLTADFSNVYNCIWADEWLEDGSIYNQKQFEKFKQSYARIDVISPELHYNEGHPKSKNIDEIKKLWKNIISWNSADGICTDYPSILYKASIE